MAEKTKEKFVETVNDELLGLNIYAAQDKFDEYKLRFDTLLNNQEFDQAISAELGKTLMKFNKDEQKNERLMLTEKLTRKMRDNSITYDGNLFHNIVYVLTES